MNRYSFQGEYESDRMARSMARELHISPKHSIEICNKLRGMMVKDAKELENRMGDILFEGSPEEANRA